MADSRKGAEFLDAQLEKKPKLRSPLEYKDAVKTLWKEGLKPGDPTGWRALDDFYSVAPGQFSVITGWPGSGKSTWLDGLLVNLAHQGWTFAMFSFEKQPVQLHISHLIEQYAGHPFPAGQTERVPYRDLDEIVDEIAKHFHFTETTSGAFSLKDCLDTATPFLEKFEDRRGIVIDPWNEIDHWRPQGLSETDWVSNQLSMVRNWARTNKVHVWIVAHPAKQPREKGKLPIPRPDMIHGASHWWNKSDCCICVDRDQGDHDSNEVRIHVQKIRFRHIGRQGSVILKYDRVTGQYHSESFGDLRGIKGRLL